MEFEIGQTVKHKMYPDFRGTIAGRKSETHLNVKVIAGWQGPTVPTWDVPIPIEKVEVVQDEG